MSIECKRRVILGLLLKDSFVVQTVGDFFHTFCGVALVTT